MHSKPVAGEDGMKNKSTHHRNCRNHWYRLSKISNIVTLAMIDLTPTAVNAYTAAGDRNFPAQMVLPQIGPTDALWVPISTQPFEAVGTGDNTRQTNFTETYGKLITERLGIQFEYGLTHIDRLRTSSITGAQNFHG